MFEQVDFMRNFLNTKQLCDQEARQLVRAYQDGNNKSLERLVQGFSSMIVYFIPYDKRNSDEAYDLYQSGIIGLINAAKNFDCKSETKFSTYAYLSIKRTISKNKIHDQVSFYDCIDDLPLYKDDISDSVIAATDYDLLNSELIKIPERERNMIEKHFGITGESMTFNEIGKEYGISKQAVHSQVKRYLESLKKNRKVKELAKEYLYG